MNNVLRKCASCSKIQDRELMHKITYVEKEKKLYFNHNSKICGHSVYLCKNPCCIANFLKKKKIRKIFSDRKIENFEEIEKILSDFIQSYE